MDRLASMQAFVLVVDAHSFAAAARRLAVSPTTVTQQVQFLEDRLGVQLLNRTTRKLSLTEVGRRYHQRCSRILADIEEAESCASTLQTAARGLLRLNTSIWLARVVAPVIAEFSAAYPDVSFEIIMTDHMVDMVEEGFDLALRPGPLPDSSLISRRLGVAELTLCAAPDYLVRSGTPERPQDLASHNCLTYVQLDHHWRFTGREGEIEVDVSGNLRSNSLEALRRAAVAGQGICLVPAASVIEDLESGRLVRLLSGYRPGEPTIHALYPSGRHLSVKVRVFLDFLVKRSLGHPVPRTDPAAGVSEFAA
jgi:DNA-binding transcriptional LysR family regulator